MQRAPRKEMLGHGLLILAGLSLFVFVLVDSNQPELLVVSLMLTSAGIINLLRATGERSLLASGQIALGAAFVAFALIAQPISSELYVAAGVVLLCFAAVEHGWHTIQR